MQFNGITGPGAIVNSDGGQSILRTGRQNDLDVSELHGVRYEQAYRGNLFHVANQGVVTTTAGLATTFTGLAISNPAGSGVNAYIRRFTCAQVAVAVAGAIGIMTGTGAAAGSLVPRNAIVGGPTGKVTASAGATIATPVLEEVYGQVGSLATTGYGETPGIIEEDVGLIIPPGFYAATYTTAATTTALVFGFQWEEVPQ